MKFKEANSLVSKLGGFNALNYPVTSLEPFTDLPHRNFVMDPVNKKEYSEHCNQNKGMKGMELYKTYTGEFTVVVIFADQINNPKIEKPCPYEIFLRKNNFDITTM